MLQGISKGSTACAPVVSPAFFSSSNPVNKFYIQRRDRVCVCEGGRRGMQVSARARASIACKITGAEACNRDVGALSAGKFPQVCAPFQQRG